MLYPIHSNAFRLMALADSYACTTPTWRIASRKLDLLDSVVVIDELRVPPGNRLEALKGDRKGQHSIRINEQYRICFHWSEAGPTDVEIVDYH